MIKAGITGNMGSGKSTVARIFTQLEIPVYHADERAKYLMMQWSPLVRSIKNLLGEEAYHPDGNLNRKWIADRIFKDAALLQNLNALVHPAVFRDFDNWVEQQNAPYVVKEAALLIESGSYKTLDTLILVTADEQERMERCMQRDGISKADAEARMSNQMKEEEEIPYAEFIIRNNHTDLIIPQVLRIHEALLKKAELAGK